MREVGAQLLKSMLTDLKPGGALGEDAFLYSKQAWDFLTDQYRKHCTDPSFVDYFWTVRIMHKPLWQLARVAEGLPAAKVLHTVSTGYAGFLGALAHYRSGRPLLVSEHGIYTNAQSSCVEGAVSDYLLTGAVPPTDLSCPYVKPAKQQSFP